MDRQTNRWTDRQTDSQTDGQTARQCNRADKQEDCLVPQSLASPLTLLLPHWRVVESLRTEREEGQRKGHRVGSRGHRGHIGGGVNTKDGFWKKGKNMQLLNTGRAAIDSSYGAWPTRAYSREGGRMGKEHKMREWREKQREREEVREGGERVGIVELT